MVTSTALAGARYWPRHARPPAAVRLARAAGAVIARRGAWLLMAGIRMQGPGALVRL